MLKFNQLTSQNDTNEQDGMRFLFMGMSAAIRNPRAHSAGREDDPAEALEMLSFLSFLLRKLDVATPA